MADKQNYRYVNLSGKKALTLDVEGAVYTLTQVHMSYAVNEIPIAMCVLAVGRDVKSFKAAFEANIHKRNDFHNFKRAKILFRPLADSGSGKTWPPGDPKLNNAVVIFDGLLTHFTYRKVDGKISLTVQLRHWLADLDCSSTLTGRGHVANPSQLNESAITATALNLGAAPAYTDIGTLTENILAQRSVDTDLWSAIKQMFCFLASQATLPIQPWLGCSIKNADGKDTTVQPNHRALGALSKLEEITADNPDNAAQAVGGFGVIKDKEKCAFINADFGIDNTKRYSRPLALKTDPTVQKAIAAALAAQTVSEFASMTFWGKLVGQFCPAFSLAVVPMTHRALVVANLPAYRGGFWKTIEADEYTDFDYGISYEHPISGVGVFNVITSDMMRGKDIANQRGGSVLAGCYVEQTVDPDQGVFMTVAPPPWLKIAASSAQIGLDVSGIKTNTPGRAVGGGVVGQAISAFGTDLRSFYDRYAQMVYANNVLRGRNGNLAGRLRFDIAPGSILRIAPKEERFIVDRDELASPMIGYVTRVAITMNAEDSVASTSFTLSHIRRENPDNKHDRTSIATHPLFGDAIHGEGKHGAPLLPYYDI